mgnify:FL=1
MSASREKKNRQELASQGIKDPKAIREAEEKAKQRKANRLYGTIAVVFVVVAALLLVVKSGVLYRDPDAVTIDGQNYTVAQVNYYYRGLANSIAKAGYYGLDNSKPLTQQVMNDTAKMLLQVTDEGDVTWDQFLKEYAVKQLSLRAMVVKAAEANGMGADDAIKAEVQETISSLKESLKPEGYSLKSYLKLAYGQGMTPSLFEEMLTADEVASHYMQHYEESLTYTVDELEADYQEHPATFDVASYEYIYFKGSAPSTTDADGNTVQPTEEESAAAKNAAAAAAKAALERYQNGESLAEISEDLKDLGSYGSVDAGSNNGSAMSAWVFDSARTAGEGAVVEDDPNSYVVVFRSIGREEYNTVDVRHILFRVDSSSLDKDSETYDADLQALKDGAKAKAEDALAQWQANGGTEDAFAALANELSEDGGSNTKGGLYTKITKGQMVAEFNDWCFDPARKTGDTGIVYNEGSYTGYHVMYFVGQDVPAWQVAVENHKASEDYNTWTESLLEQANAQELDGMKDVG